MYKCNRRETVNRCGVTKVPSTLSFRRTISLLLATVQAPSECERQGAGEGVVHDEVDVKAAEHVAGLHMTCTDHTGRRFAGERPRGDESPEQSICSPRRSAAAVPLWPLRSETPEGVEDERERISKIRARPPLRLRAVHTTGAADGAESATREREVVDRKVGHMPRHYGFTP